MVAVHRARLRGRIRPHSPGMHDVVMFRLPVRLCLRVDRGRLSTRSLGGCMSFLRLVAAIVVAILFVNVALVAAYVALLGVLMALSIF